MLECKLWKSEIWELKGQSIWHFPFLCQYLLQDFWSVCARAELFAKEMLSRTLTIEALQYKVSKLDVECLKVATAICSMYCVLWTILTCGLLGLVEACVWVWYPICFNFFFLFMMSFLWLMSFIEQLVHNKSCQKN